MVGRRVASAPLVAGLLIATFATLQAAAQAGEPRAVLELFTSQGCSSCPPADKLLGELSADPSLVALSVPIDYWDYLGWKDTLASSVHSARQRAYAHQRGDRQVYTPQSRGQRRGACARQRPRRNRTRDHADRPEAGRDVAAGSCFDGRQRPQRAGRCGEDRSCLRRSLDVSADEGGPGCHRARREPRPHHHLSQRRA